ncbi:MAG: hypothetical protein BWY89_00714 [Bacteroidetes bacterium ADurb.BinA012]|nr:MAG: hypothetical protein BWY89_00714 [Bacteroidetes bacterium ADurb.BinA012]
MVSASSGQGSRPDARNTSGWNSVAAQILFSSPMAVSARHICATSRGVTLLTATLLSSLSRSPTSRISPSIISFTSGWPIRYSTMSSLVFSTEISFSGSESHRFIILPPMGESVRSMISISVFAPSKGEWKSSRLRTVNLSSHTYFSSSIRARRLMWPRFS